MTSEVQLGDRLPRVSRALLTRFPDTFRSLHTNLGSRRRIVTGDKCDGAELTGGGGSRPRPESRNRRHCELVEVIALSHGKVLLDVVSLNVLPWWGQSNQAITETNR